MERRGKSSPDGWEQPIAVNSIRSNAVEGHTGRPGRPGEAARARQQWRVEIDGCLKRQNPAYRLTAFLKKSRSLSDCGFLLHGEFKLVCIKVPYQRSFPCRDVGNLTVCTVHRARSPPGWPGAGRKRPLAYHLGCFVPKHSRTDGIFLY